MDEGAVGHHALPLHIGQEGTALLAGGEDAEDGGHLPHLPGLHGGFAAPDALGELGIVRLGVFLFLQRAHGQGESDFPLAGNRFALGLDPVAQQVIPLGGNFYGVGIVGIGVSGTPGVKVGVKDGPLGGKELHAGGVQLVVSLVASLVLEGNGAGALAVNGDGAFRAGYLFPVLLFQLLRNVEIARP